MKYCKICVLQLFINQVVKSQNLKLNLIISNQAVFFYSTKKSRQKFKCLENEKRFEDEVKNIFHYFKKVSLKQTKQFFLTGESPTLSSILLFEQNLK